MVFLLTLSVKITKTFWGLLVLAVTRETEVQVIFREQKKGCLWTYVKPFSSKATIMCRAEVSVL